MNGIRWKGSFHNVSQTNFSVKCGKIKGNGLVFLVWSDQLIFQIFTLL